MEEGILLSRVDLLFFHVGLEGEDVTAGVDLIFSFIVVFEIL